MPAGVPADGVDAVAGVVGGRELVVCDRDVARSHPASVTPKEVSGRARQAYRACWCRSRRRSRCRRRRKRCRGGWSKRCRGGWSKRRRRGWSKRCRRCRRWSKRRCRRKRCRRRKCRCRRKGRSRRRRRCSRRNVAVNERGALVYAGDSGGEGSLNIVISPIDGYESGVSAIFALLTHKDNVATQPWRGHCEVGLRIIPDELDLLLFRREEGQAPAEGARRVRDNVDAFRELRET